MSRKSLSLRASAIESMPWFHAVFVESKVLLQGAQFFQLEFDRILLCQNLGRVLERSIYDEGLSELCFEAPTMWHERLFSWKLKWKSQVASLGTCGPELAGKWQRQIAEIAEGRSRSWGPPGWPSSLTLTVAWPGAALRCRLLLGFLNSLPPIPFQQTSTNYVLSLLPMLTVTSSNIKLGFYLSFDFQLGNARSSSSAESRPYNSHAM